MRSRICICSSECGFDTKNITPPWFALVSLFHLALSGVAAVAAVAAVLGDCRLSHRAHGVTRREL